MKDTQIKQITFSKILLDQGEERAKSLGISFAEYMRHLVINDIESELDKVPTFVPNKRQRKIIKDSLKLKDSDFIKIQPKDILSL